MSKKYNLLALSLAVYLFPFPFTPPPSLERACALTAKVVTTAQELSGPRLRAPQERRPCTEPVRPVAPYVALFKPSSAALPCVTLALSKLLARPKSRALKPTFQAWSTPRVARRDTGGTARRVPPKPVHPEPGQTRSPRAACGDTRATVTTTAPPSLGKPLRRAHPSV